MEYDLDMFDDSFLDDIEYETDYDDRDYDYDDDCEDIFATWLEYNIYGDRDSCVIHVSTNDNNDDGFPDASIESWELSFTGNERGSAIEQALKHTGVSRTGMSGCNVYVSLNGEEVYSDN